MRGDPRQELRLHVLADQPVIATEGVRFGCDLAALLKAEGGQVQPGRPSLGLPVQLRHIILADRYACVVQQGRRLLMG